MKTIKFLSQAVAIMLLMLFCVQAQAQFTLSGELRPRAEYRNGFKELVAQDHEPAAFISQRSRLNLHYQNENLRFGLSLQDVRVWGDLGQLAASSNSMMLHQAWGEYFVNDKFSLKFGRQELVYDDARILGNVDWAQQARAHDVFLFKYEGESKLHFGLAFNQVGELLSGTYYMLPGYKSMQFLWFNHRFSSTGLSLLLLNNGLQHDYVQDDEVLYKTVYSQTMGGRLTQALGRLQLYGEAYYTTGKNRNDIELDAHLWKFGGKYTFDSGWGMAAGWEWLSGTSQLEDTGADYFVNRSFEPFYGTNHKFNGYMDYFYVGNHLNGVGLSDIHAGVFYSKNKFGATLTAHIFAAAADVIDDQSDTMDKKLGTELDFSINYKLAQSLTISAGYSQMFGTETLQQLRGGDHNATNNWAWIMLTFKPVFI